MRFFPKQNESGILERIKSQTFVRKQNLYKSVTKQEVYTFLWRHTEPELLQCTRVQLIETQKVKLTVIVIRREYKTTTS